MHQPEKVALDKSVSLNARNEKCVTCVSVEDREGPPEAQHNVQLEQKVEDRGGDEEQRYSGQRHRDGDQVVGVWGTHPCF